MLFCLIEICTSSSHKCRRKICARKIQKLHPHALGLGRNFRGGGWFWRGRSLGGALLDYMKINNIPMRNTRFRIPNSKIPNPRNPKSRKPKVQSQEYQIGNPKSRKFRIKKQELQGNGCVWSSQVHHDPVSRVGYSQSWFSSSNHWNP